jgi:hypothetical protein
MAERREEDVGVGVLERRGEILRHDLVVIEKGARIEFAHAHHPLYPSGAHLAAQSPRSMAFIHPGGDAWSSRWQSR